MGVKTLRVFLPLIIAVGVAGGRPMDKFLRRRWPDNTIPVSVSDSMTEAHRGHVYEAMAVLSRLTCLDFVNASRSSGYSLRIQQDGKGCYSFIGYTNSSKRFQVVNLSPNCFSNGPGTAMHEFIHAVGFKHEHQRLDRDDYLTVHEERIKPEEIRSFRKLQGRYDYLMTLGLPYDYSSIMHYSVWAFAKGIKPTMSLKRYFKGVVGQRVAPSRGDVALITRFYECQGYYLGDDIPGAIPYEEFHAGFMAAKPKFSDRLREWDERMQKVLKNSKREEMRKMELHQKRWF